MSYSRYRHATKVVSETEPAWISPEPVLINTDEHYDDTYHTVKQGDRLDTLAWRYLGDAELWWVIAEYNQIFWFQDITIGQSLRIPSYEHLQLDLLRR